MKTTIKILVLILFTLEISAQSTDFRKMENNAFSEGEVLTFNVNYGFITAGIAEMAIPKIKRISGRDTYHITFKVNSVPSFDPFFKVRDRYETYMDVEGLFPWRFEQHVREGNYKRDLSAFFDQRRNVAKTRKGTYEVPDYVHDIVSAFYFARTIDYDTLQVGDKIHLKNFFKDKVYPLDVVYLGTETVTVEAGTFECVMVEPLVQEGGLFKSEGNITIWLSNDNNKIPVKVKTKVIIGSIDAELKSYEGLRGEAFSKR